MTRFRELAEGRVWTRAVFPLPFVLLALLGSNARSTAFREVEVQCEEAKAHLLDCCAAFSSDLACEYVDRGCEPPTTPDLDVQESRRVQSLTCAEVRASDYCSYRYPPAPDPWDE